MKTLAICALSVLLPYQPLSVGQQPKQPPARDHACEERLSAGDVQKMERDVAKMRALVSQMQLNLAAATTGETPLKHQFQLEIDMWQLLIAQMQDRLEANRQR